MTEKYRAAIYIERDLWNWARKHAIDTQQSASELIERLLSEYKNQTSDEEHEKTRQAASRAKTKKRG